MTLRFNLRNQGANTPTHVETNADFDLQVLLDDVGNLKWVAVESAVSGNTVCFRTSDIASIVDKSDE